MRRADGQAGRTGGPPPSFARSLRLHTISGKRSYLEHDWVATAGDFVDETPGESHTLVAHDHPDPMKVFFIVKGPLIWLNEKGEPDGHSDVRQCIALCRVHCEKVGLGSATIDKLFR